MKRTGEREMLLTLKNRVNRELKGQFTIAMECALDIVFEPASGTFRVPASGTTDITIKADLNKLEVFENAVARLTLDDASAEEAYAWSARSS